MPNDPCLVRDADAAAVFPGRSAIRRAHHNGNTTPHPLSPERFLNVGTSKYDGDTDMMVVCLVQRPIRSLGSFGLKRRLEMLHPVSLFPFKTDGKRFGLCVHSLAVGTKDIGIQWFMNLAVTRMMLLLPPIWNSGWLKGRVRKVLACLPMHAYKDWGYAMDSGDASLLLRIFTRSPRSSLIEFLCPPKDQPLVLSWLSFTAAEENLQLLSIMLVCYCR